MSLWVLLLLFLFFSLFRHQFLQLLSHQFLFLLKPSFLLSYLLFPLKTTLITNEPFWNFVFQLHASHVETVLAVHACFHFRFLPRGLAQLTLKYSFLNLFALLRFLVAIMMPQSLLCLKRLGLTLTLRAWNLDHLFFLFCLYHNVMFWTWVNDLSSRSSFVFRLMAMGYVSIFFIVFWVPKWILRIHGKEWLWKKY
jgi:hypothetical protein